MYKKLILIISFCFATFGYAQDTPKQFSLDEAINYALEHNRTVKNAQRDIEAAKKQKWETTATGLPQINASVEYQNWLKQIVSLIPGEIAGGEPGTFVPVRFGTKQTLNATATLSQLLFDGSYLVGLQSAKVFLEISENAKEKTDLEIRKAVINAYGNVLLAEESIIIFERNKATLQKNLDETRKIYENGLTEEENVEQLEITLASIESNLRNVKRLRDLAYQMLNITLGIDLNAETKVTDDLENLASKNMLTGLLDTDDNVQDLIDYKIAANDKRSKELLLKLEKSKALPSLSAFINGGYAGNSDDFTFFKNDQEWFGSSLFGVTLNVPIFSSLGRSAATQRAKINLEKAEESLLETEQQLKFQVDAAKSDFQLAIEEYNTAKKNLGLAERIEKKNQVKFFEGISTSFDLRQAQTQLYTAQQEFLQAMVDVINKKAELETVLNEIN